MKKENLTNTDIEFYLLNREYSHLQGDEKKFVDEHVSSEQEFNELKAIFQGISSVLLEEEELIPDPKIKAHLLKEFNTNRPAGGYWANGILLTLFPKEKKLFHKPGVQFIGLAASIALVIGIFINVGTPLKHNEMAQNKAEEEIVSPTAPQEIEEKIKEDNDIAEEKEAEEFELAKEESGTKMDANKNLEAAEQEINSLDIPDANNEQAKDIDNQKYNSNISSKIVTTDLAEEDDKTTISTNESTIDLVVSGAVPATSTTESTAGMAIEELADDETEDVSFSRSANYKASQKDQSNNSRSLSEDADLIGLLYTAL